MWLALLSTNGIAVSNPAAILLFITAVTVVVVTLGVMLAITLQNRRPAQLLFSVLTLVLFGGAVLLPEHPATTVAKLAVDSPTRLTYSHVGGAVLLAVAGSPSPERHQRVAAEARDRRRNSLACADASPSMEYTTLGDDRHGGSRICLGCMSFGTSDWRDWV